MPPKPQPQPSPQVTLLRLRMIAEQAVKYRVTGMACADIMAPHCAVVLYTLTRGFIAVQINGEAFSTAWALSAKQAHEAFALMQAEMRQSGPMRLRHVND